MQKYLVTKYKDFYDGHGTSESGEIYKFISDNPIFDIIEDGDTFYSYNDIEDYTINDIVEFGITKNNYKNKIEGYIDETENIYPEDGYHVSSVTYYFVKITDEKAIHIQYILNEYSKL